VTSAIAYFVHVQRERKAGRGGVSGGGGGGGGGGDGEWAQPAVVVNPNPLQRGQAASWSANSSGGAGRARAAFGPQATGGAVPGFDMWTQCTEVTTGKTWFYCEATGVTVWALPPGHRIVKQLVQ
jgi:hypothetical protein